MTLPHAIRYWHDMSVHTTGSSLECQSTDNSKKNSYIWLVSITECLTMLSSAKHLLMCQLCIIQCEECANNYSWIRFIAFACSLLGLNTIDAFCSLIWIVALFDELLLTHNEWMSDVISSHNLTSNNTGIPIILIASRNSELLKLPRLFFTIIFFRFRTSMLIAAKNIQAMAF